MSRLRLIQFVGPEGERGVALFRVGTPARIVDGFATTLDLAREALAQGIALEQMAADLAGARVDLSLATLVPAIDHPDAAHLYVTGTGLTHLGSAESRNAMHAAQAAGAVTDSMRMYQMGLAGEKLAPADAAQPEWFYKGDGSCLVGPNDALIAPAFALDGSEEPEVAGIYLIDDRGVPRRLGFALGNEFSDHVTERGNYLWLAHSKLRAAALGAELLLGDLPADVVGISRVVRGGETIWQKPFLTGEENMSYSIENLERHHFKYAAFRRPGDVHVHFFGTATLSYADGIVTEPGDRFQISADCFALPLNNRFERAPAENVAVGRA